MIKKLDRKKPHQKYFVGKVQVPGVTTVLSVIGKPFLVPWAWKMGMQGKDYKELTGEAASIGSIAHFLCECFVTGHKANLEDYHNDEIDIAKSCTAKFIKFWRAGGYTLVSSEKQLVSKSLRFGGTLDLVARDKNKKLLLIDLKTSKAIYEDYWHQVSAYKKLHEENKLGIINKVVICRIPKDASDFETEERTLAQLENHWGVFKAALNLHQALNKTK